MSNHRAIAVLAVFLAVFLAFACGGTGDDLEEGYRDGCIDNYIDAYGRGYSNSIEPQEIVAWVENYCTEWAELTALYIQDPEVRKRPALIELEPVGYWDGWALGCFHVVELVLSVQPPLPEPMLEKGWDMCQALVEELR